MRAAGWTVPTGGARQLRQRRLTQDGCTLGWGRGWPLAENRGGLSGWGRLHTKTTRKARHSLRSQPRREGGGGVARQAGPAGVRLEEGAAGRVHSGPQLSLLGCLRPEGFRSQYLCESELFRLPTYLPGAWAA